MRSRVIYNIDKINLSRRDGTAMASSALIQRATRIAIGGGPDGLCDGVLAGEAGCTPLVGSKPTTM